MPGTHKRKLSIPTPLSAVLGELPILGVLSQCEDVLGCTSFVPATAFSEAPGHRQMGSALHCHCSDGKLRPKGADWPQGHMEGHVELHDLARAMVFLPHGASTYCGSFPVLEVPVPPLQGQDG